MDEYCVVLSEPAKAPWPVFAAVLVDAGAMSRTDANQAARQCRGILAERLSRDAAEAVAGNLQRGGFGYAILRQESIPRMPIPCVPKVVRIDAEAIKLELIADNPGHRIPWFAIKVIVGGRVRRVEFLKRLSQPFQMPDPEGDPGSDLNWQREVERKTERLTPSIEFLAEVEDEHAPSIARVRIEPRGLRCPDAVDDADGESGESAFLFVLRELLKRADEADVSPKVKGAIAPDAIPIDAEDVEAEARFRWALRESTINW
ncbi:hypothetical protein [Stratiformator vulcanicus]|uniref:Uncharacterized protein n=1 Tax=Stratiformator vulcanicus TaxID=2527980 RepID=A0A517R027_9PLAN|nr:hypothetical protein [Stratiformator vulcanicus]QDT37170.1 hypothetical protein Pan189_15420 [Stratiformator vulcanicus]